MPEIANAMNEIVEWVEQMPKPKIVTAGPNILVREDDTSISIEGAPAGESGGGTEACVFKLILENDGDENKKVTASAFTVNGLLPDNLDDIGSVSNEGTYYVVLNAGSSQSGITELSYAIEEEFSLEPQYKENLPPTSIKILAAVIQNANYTPALCAPIFMSPAIAYTDMDANKTYYYWSINQSEIYIT
jgi:hypothetical protein